MSKRKHKYKNKHKEKHESFDQYEFTAFSATSLLSQGNNGSSIGYGDTFKMPAHADTHFSVADDDPYLSGDSRCDERADDRTGQTASIQTDGEEVGNGGKIYAEVYHWVYDQHGNWYVMVEIEQEGNNEDYFTFYTGHGYTMPPEGAHLTVYTSCNVTSEWIKFDNLDAGEKYEEPTGTISGTVFHDTNCDGINGALTIVEGHSYTIEAEHMHEWGFHVAHGAQASGGRLVKLDCAGGSGKLWTDFKGKDGTYDLKIRVQDENDGQSIIKLAIDGRYVDAVRLDRDTDGRGSDHGGFSTYVIKDVQIDHGDQIKLVVYGDRGEFVRIDKIDIEGEDTSIYEPEPVKAGVTINLLDLDGNIVDTTVTDHDGNYSFANVPVGDYRIEGIAPDGTKFTIQDAGSDDTLDSDVDGNGLSDVVTVTDGGTVDIDLGVCEIKEGTISGTVFHDTNCDGLNGTAGTADRFPTWAQDISNVVVYFDRDGDGVIDFSVKVDDFPDGGSGRFISNDLDDYFAQLSAFIVSEMPELSADTTIVGASIKGGTQTTQFYPVSGSAGADGPTMNTGPGNDAVLSYGDFFATYVPGQGAGGGSATSEPGKPGVTIRLLDAEDGTLVAETTTDADGNYRFDSVPVGEYVIMGVAPDGKKFTLKDVGDDDTIDSDVDEHGMSDVFTVTVGADTDIDLGVCKIVVTDDAGKGCADELIRVDLSDNIKAGAAITAIDGVELLDGQTKLISGVNVSRDGDVFIFDGEEAYAGLDIGEMDSQSFTFTVAEGGGTATGNIDVMFCGNANSVDSFYAALPASVEYQLTYALDGNTAPFPDFAYDLTIVNSGDARFDGVTFTAAYCLDFATAVRTIGESPVLNTGVVFGAQSAAAIGAYDERTLSTANGLPGAENADLVNWVIAQDFEEQGVSGWAVQFAIWELADNFDASIVNYDLFENTELADVEAIVTEALLNDGFEAQVGDTVGMIIDPGTSDPDNIQPFIVALDWQQYDCLC